MYQKRNKELEVVGLFSGNYDLQLYLREISKLAKLPVKTTQNVLNILVKAKILKSEQRGKNKYFSLNKQNIQTKFRLLQAEIQKTAMFLEKHPQFNTFLKDITMHNPIILFGSFAKFTADKNSDVDILTISEKELQLPTHLLPNKLHAINISENNFMDSLKKREALIKEIEENHVILNNHSFFVNTMWDYYGTK
ncbi:hypothetical protein CMO88_00350 [Candidatus Woesearchaeota archaeon]|nr:hypothetical protein [Candidatus Woesearchaeota archaeon]|tara:strand:- start:54026 stop:54607 length:582 start_codon:yes stop_codon:yes gene_type:complete